ncbi:GNAT family N-acetyltransferase [Amphibacillus cookii]|uniref:GNAT family N-acetyltransferase n=1 Tax=Amphibacillus cookii TaxID=767787 RepID=UPI00195A9864|nr:GNAT family N-acetyltransferase [Amphibacillus cookii]MBM7541993.1 phosphinothricin acetyltransferase [Amphibacillus cookii]
MLPTDWSQVKRIYEEGIASGHATFEREAPTWTAWDASHLKACRWVATQGDRVLGWTALSPTSSRCVYRGVTEVSVYIGCDYRGNGVGRALLKKVIESSEQEGIWTIHSGIFPENKASVALHQSLGFRQVGYFERIGKMEDKWRDTIYLERRSQVVGIN